ncbi:MAG: DUF2812 domain-containing protein, partial [Tissierellia bacterium]|nr:DUF2812 domain-containing protein [Tissierellia bacterium]
PYEIETLFTKKSREELEEFNSVCESVGWNYATKSYDLHVYFKEHGVEAMDIQTDEEEEFRTLEFIGKKHIRSYYVLIPFLLFVSWFVLGSLFTSIPAIKNGLIQIVTPLIPAGIILLIIHLFNIKRFLKINRKNIELGKSLEFSDSKFYITRTIFAITSIILFLGIIHFLYVAIFLKNKFMLIGLIPTLIGIIGATIYRIYIKPAKMKLKHKKIGFIVILVASTVLSIVLFVGVILNIAIRDDNKHSQNIDSYKVLSINDFISDTLEEEGEIIELASILIPKSYDYYSYSRGFGSIRTEYSKALTEEIASNLVDRYRSQAENKLIRRNSRRLELYFEEGIFDDYLLRSGLTKEDLSNLEGKELKEAIKAANNMINEKSIVEDIENLWNLDEVYFLNIEKDEIVIRNGKEVFYLEGLDFSDKEIIKIIKDKLNLYKK